MTAVPSPDPESGPPTRPVTGRPAPAVPALSIGRIGDVRPGALLVAMPALTDPTFAGTVVYVLDHSETGSLGVVLGRPSQVEIRDVLPGWCDLAVAPEVFHVGGPCETDTALCLAVCPGAPAPAEESPLRRVAGNVHLVDLDSDPADLQEELSGLRVFAGYAGWSAGQLADEISEGAWACVPGRPEDVLCPASGPELWRTVLGRQTGRLAVLSTAPADPSVN
jgi:putative transcriptional regulator